MKLLLATLLSLFLGCAAQAEIKLGHRDLCLDSTTGIGTGAGTTVRFNRCDRDDSGQQWSWNQGLITQVADAGGLLCLIRVISASSDLLRVESCDYDTKSDDFHWQNFGFIPGGSHVLLQNYGGFTGGNSCLELGGEFGTTGIFGVNFNFCSYSATQIQHFHRPHIADFFNSD